VLHLRGIGAEWHALAPMFGACHAEGLGFESHHPLEKPPQNSGFCFLNGNVSPK